MASKKEYNLDILENLKGTVASLNKAIDTLKNTNETVAESASTLKKQFDTLSFKKTHEFTTVQSANIIRGRLEQFIDPTIESISSQANAELQKLNEENALLSKKLQSQKARMNLNLLDKSNTKAKEQEEEEERELIKLNQQLKQELRKTSNDITRMSNTIKSLSNEIEIAREKVKKTKPELSRMKKARLELKEENERLIKLENEMKQKIEQKRNAAASKADTVDDQIQLSAQSPDNYSKEKAYEFIQNVLSHITNPDFVASKSSSTECIEQAKCYKETLQKKKPSLDVDISNPEAVEEWLTKKANSLGKGLISDPQLSKTASRMVELLVSKSAIPLTDLQMEFPADKNERHGLPKILNILVKAGTIRLEGGDIILES